MMFELTSSSGFMSNLHLRLCSCVLGAWVIGGLCSMVERNYGSVLRSAIWPVYADQQLNAFELVKELGLAREIKMDFNFNPLAIRSVDEIPADEVPGTKVPNWKSWDATEEVPEEEVPDEEVPAAADEVPANSSLAT
ncbi:Glycosyltransferase [Quillaja saponaria]|uniref:Glycosyltransferase n=1 Tax=Quillaja saponaria TaxID=32244 RepID=A0AAD7LLV3_QUISA|nr:Glycosyltransferase [Quillaja saponaria]